MPIIDASVRAGIRKSSLFIMIWSWVSHNGLILLNEYKTNFKVIKFSSKMNTSHSDKLQYFKRINYNVQPTN